MRGVITPWRKGFSDLGFYTAGMIINPELNQKQHAKYLYWQGWAIRRIAELMGLPESTVGSWKNREKWDDATPLDRVNNSLEARLMQLIHKDDKDGKDYKEIDLLGRQLERTARIERYNNGGNEADLNPNVRNRNSGPRKAPEKNAISEEQEKQLVDGFLEGMFDYQRTWYQAGLAHRIRDILKSRQIGATYFFAHEAFIDALQTGRNQIFLSASKAQAHVFKQYIIQFAKDVAGVELKGDPIILPNGAHLYFLGTNIRTAQSYHGNLYLDEYFWIHKFQEFRKVASGMAIHKKWRQTYFSTPSAVTHGAYPFWTGTLFNKGRPKAERIEIDTSHAALVNGALCADGHWRQIVTVEDAVRGGCNLFDIDQLRLEYSPDEFDNLLMCQFIDDTQSVFPFGLMQRCMVDSWELWTDYKPFAPRPLAYMPVWVGYDPAKGGNGDSAGCVVIAPPAVPGGKFRIIEKHRWHGMDYEAQAKAIKQITERYNVTFIGIDTTGLGDSVFQLVKKFFPMVTPFHYNPVLKQQMVIKAYDVISKGRMEFDSSWSDISQAFICIRKTLTANGRQVTYQASRSEEVSHADIAWATMHALYNEPLDHSSGGNTSTMEIYV